VTARLGLAGPARFELEVRKSRFVAHAEPVATVEAAMVVIARCSEVVARHHCWAYRLGDRYRFHDADEPAGTAGRPILQAIDGQRVDQVVVVVSRWFGGIKLGAGGLVRAYGGCAAECLRRAEKVSIIHLVEADIACTFSDSGAVHALLAQHAAVRVSERFDEAGVTLRVRAAQSAVDALAVALRDATRGRATLTVAHASP
jgi:uncharacterized YigZ family protein